MTNKSLKKSISNSINIIARNLNKKISIITTHNARLRCLLRNFTIENIPKYDKIRFKNCVILRLSIQINKTVDGTCNISLEMVYGGEIDESENKVGYIYFKPTSAHKFMNKSKTRKQSVSKASLKYRSKKSKIKTSIYKNQDGGFNSYTEVEFPKIEMKDIDINTDLMNLLNISNITFKMNKNTEYVFYLVRHGQADHNLYKDKYSKVGKLLKNYQTPDTPLTEIGMQQANTAGLALKKILTNNNELSDPNDLQRFFLFVSDLKRTHQTMEKLLSILTTKTKKFIIKAKKDKKNIIDITANNSISVISQTEDNTKQLTAYVLPCSHELTYSKVICDKKME